MSLKEMGYLFSYLIEKSITLTNTWQKACQGGIVSIVTDFIVDYKVFSNLKRAEEYYRNFLAPKYEFICFYDTKNTLIKQL